MKSIYIIFSLLVSCLALNAQNTQSVQTAFSSGNASAMTADMASDIELCIGDDVQFLSKSQAVTALNKWFQQVQPSDVNGKIDGAGSVKYYNGNVKTASGNFRVFVYYSAAADGKGFKIDEIRIGKGK